MWLDKTTQPPMKIAKYTYIISAIDLSYFLESDCIHNTINSKTILNPGNGVKKEALKMTVMEVTVSVFVSQENGSSRFNTCSTIPYSIQ